MTAEEWIFVPLALLPGALLGFIAYRRGHSVVLWWLAGTVMFFPLVVIAVFMTPDLEVLERRRHRAR